MYISVPIIVYRTDQPVLGTFSLSTFWLLFLWTLSLLIPTQILFRVHPTRNIMCYYGNPSSVVPSSSFVSSSFLLSRATIPWLKTVTSNPNVLPVYLRRFWTIVFVIRTRVIVLGDKGFWIDQGSWWFIGRTVGVAGYTIRDYTEVWFSSDW